MQVSTAKSIHQEIASVANRWIPIGEIRNQTDEEREEQSSPAEHEIDGVVPLKRVTYGMGCTAMKAEMGGPQRYLVLDQKGTEGCAQGELSISIDVHLPVKNRGSCLAPSTGETKPTTVARAQSANVAARKLGGGVE